MPPTISLSLFPPSHRVLFIDSNCRGGDRGRNVKKQNRPWGQSSTTLLPEERKHSPPLFSLFHSLFLSFTLTAAPFPQSSSAPLWAAFKDSKCEDSNSVRVIAADRNLPYSHSVQSTLFIDQLHVFCVVLRNLCPLYWKMLNFQPQHWLLCKKKIIIGKNVFSVSGRMLPIGSRGRREWHVAEWSLILWGSCLLFLFCLLTYSPNVIRMFII